jgi:hypothetical protein
MPNRPGSRQWTLKGGGGEEETRRGKKTLTLGLLYFSLISEKGLFQNVITKYYSLRSLI